jgi:hypothetical protein
MYVRKYAPAVWGIEHNAQTDCIRMRIQLASKFKNHAQETECRSALLNAHTFNFESGIALTVVSSKSYHFLSYMFRQYAVSATATAPSQESAHMRQSCGYCREELSCCTVYTSYLAGNIHRPSIPMACSEAKRKRKSTYNAHCPSFPSGSAEDVQ